MLSSRHAEAEQLCVRIRILYKIQEIFKRIEKYRFKVGLEKCEFCMNKIEYLGQIIDHEGRRPNPKRTEAIKNITKELLDSDKKF